MREDVVFVWVGSLILPTFLQMTWTHLFKVMEYPLCIWTRFSLFTDTWAGLYLGNHEQQDSKDGCVVSAHCCTLPSGTHQEWGQQDHMAVLFLAAPLKEESQN